MTMNNRTWMRALMAGLLLLVGGPSLASAQCDVDADCASGERCEAPVSLETCVEEPCADPAEDGGRCVPEQTGEACLEDADCGDALVCLHLLLAGCPEFDPECAPDQSEGFCGEEGSDAVLAATSGLAPGSMTASDSAGDAPAPAAQSASPDAGGCSVAGPAGGLSMLSWLGAAALLMRRRRRQ